MYSFSKIYWYNRMAHTGIFATETENNVNIVEKSMYSS